MANEQSLNIKTLQYFAVDPDTNFVLAGFVSLLNVLNFCEYMCRDFQIDHLIITDEKGNMYRSVLDG